MTHQQRQQPTRLFSSSILSLATTTLLLTTTIGGCAHVPVKPQSFHNQDCVDCYTQMERGRGNQVMAGHALWIGPLFFGAGVLQLAMGGEEGTAIGAMIVGPAAVVASPIMYAVGTNQFNKGYDTWQDEHCESNP